MITIERMRAAAGGRGELAPRVYWRPAAGRDEAALAEAQWAAAARAIRAVAAAQAAAAQKENGVLI